MASESVTGATQEEVEQMRQEWESEDRDKPFEQQYCLCEIPRQPPDYDGPPRYCKKRFTISKVGSKYRCKHHGGKTDIENLTPGNMKHGMRATQEYLAKNFDEKDTALYNWVMNEWPEAYGINLEDDPAARHDFHRLAVEVVRAERGRGYLLEEGEVQEEPVRNEEGRVVIDQEGEIVTEKSEHYLVQMLHRQDKKLTQLEKELGITRKEQLKQDTTDSAVDAIKSFAEVGAAFIDREEDYDPDNSPWNDE